MVRFCCEVLVSFMKLLIFLTRVSNNSPYRCRARESRASPASRGLSGITTVFLATSIDRLVSASAKEAEGTPKSFAVISSSAVVKSEHELRSGRTSSYRSQSTIFGPSRYGGFFIALKFYIAKVQDGSNDSHDVESLVITKSQLFKCVLHHHWILSNWIP